MTPPAAGDEVGEVKTEVRIFLKWFDVMYFSRNAGAAGRGTELT